MCCADQSTLLLKSRHSHIRSRSVVRLSLFVAGINRTYEQPDEAHYPVAPFSSLVRADAFVMMQMCSDQKTLVLNAGTFADPRFAATDIARVLSETLDSFVLEGFDSPSIVDFASSFMSTSVHALVILRGKAGWVEKLFETKQVDLFRHHDPLDEGSKEMPYMLWYACVCGEDPNRWSTRAIEYSLSVMQ
jgi:hypothetical protein